VMRFSAVIFALGRGEVYLGHESIIDAYARRAPAGDNGAYESQDAKQEGE
jgi:hypothetical protein